LDTLHAKIVSHHPYVHHPHPLLSILTVIVTALHHWVSNVDSFAKHYGYTFEYEALDHPQLALV